MSVNLLLLVISQLKSRDRLSRLTSRAQTQLRAVCLSHLPFSFPGLSRCNLNETRRGSRLPWELQRCKAHACVMCVNIGIVTAVYAELGKTAAVKRGMDGSRLEQLCLPAMVERRRCVRWSVTNCGCSLPSVCLGCHTERFGEQGDEGLLRRSSRSRSGMRMPSTPRRPR